MGKGNEQPVIHRCDCQTCRQHPDSSVAEHHREINRLLAVANERTRRLVAGFLARQHGRGGIAWLARISGLSPHTVRKGLRELVQGDSLPLDRVRRSGSGRPRAEAKFPGS